jgi:hypothetical protein
VAIESAPNPNVKILVHQSIHNKVSSSAFPSLPASKLPAFNISFLRRMGFIAYTSSISVSLPLGGELVSWFVDRQIGSKSDAIHVTEMPKRLMRQQCEQDLGTIQV